jgi:short-subunit dehydrogenase
MARRDLRANRAIITGASSGIGRALATQLARYGARLVLVARREDRLNELAEQVRSAGGQAETVVGDVTDASIRQGAIERACTAFGGFDTLINNAGIGALGRFDQADPGRLRRIMEVNFFATVELIRESLPHLATGTRPLIVNIDSVLGHRGIPLSSEYCASKFAVQGFSQSIRAELASRGIDVLVVSPGTTETEFFASVIERRGEVPWGGRRGVSADYVARCTLKAMRFGRHEIVPSWSGWLLCFAQRLAPGIVDGVMSRLAR